MMYIISIYKYIHYEINTYHFLAMIQTQSKRLRYRVVHRLQCIHYKLRLFRAILYSKASVAISLRVEV